MALEAITTLLGEIECKKHERACMLKTSVNATANDGSSFYICSVPQDRCDFVKATHVPRVNCLKHPTHLTDLHYLHKSRRTHETRHYYRCRVSRDASVSWCGYSVLTTGVSSNDKELQSSISVSENHQRHKQKTISVSENHQRHDAHSAENTLITKAMVTKCVDDKSSAGAVTVQLTKNVATSNPNDPEGSSAQLPRSRVYDREGHNVRGYTGSENNRESNSGQKNNVKGVDSDVKGLCLKTKTSQNDSINRDSLTSVSRERPSSEPFVGEASRTNGAAKNNLFSVDSNHSSDSSLARYLHIDDSDVNKSSFTTEYGKKDNSSSDRVSDHRRNEWNSYRSLDDRKGQESKDLTSHEGEDVRSRDVVDLTEETDVAVTHIPQLDAIGRSTIDYKNEVMRKLDQQKLVMRSVNMSTLPDKGDKIRRRVDDLERQLQFLNIRVEDEVPRGNAPAASHTSSHTQVANKPGTEITLFPKRSEKPAVTTATPVLKQTTLLNHVERLPPHVLQQMYSSNPQAMTLYGGHMTKDRLKQVGSITRDAIDNLHKQLESAPGAEEECSDPRGLRLQLFPHQRHALAWMKWREKQQPPGGILADDMGLGKTLTMISLVLHGKLPKDPKATASAEGSDWKSKNQTVQKLNASVLTSRATLVVCPASLVHQWNSEIERRCKHGSLKVLLYHGPSRETILAKLADNDVVLTTYNIVAREIGVDETNDKTDQPVNDEDQRKHECNLLSVGWARVILDEAHSIKNHKSKTAVAVCKLRAGCRWALTGTPIQNDLLDMYSLLRFIRCSPFDELKVWKKHVDSDKYSGKARLNTLIKTLLLRRTKDQKNTAGQSLVPLPTKSVVRHSLELSEGERLVYDKVHQQSRSTFQDYLARHQGDPQGSRASPTTHDVSRTSLTRGSSPRGVDKRASGTYILVSLLRLRQCCSHLSLLKQRVEDEVLESEGIELTLEEQMRGLQLGDVTSEGVAAAARDGDTLYDRSYCSTKIGAVMNEVRQLSHSNGRHGGGSKSVIVSQWTAMLDIVAHHLKLAGISFCTIRGQVAPKKRSEIVDEFNGNSDGPRVMLLSLRAGGVGLNLVGGSHLFLLDNHWNPSLEDQACDRIYRMGQKKDVYIHRFLCQNTVEEKIIQLQQRKIGLAKDVLTGSGSTNKKLTLDDLRMLFGV